MSVILHVMRKDLRRLWLPLALLAACGLTALTLSGTGLSAHPELARVLFFTAAFFFLLGMVTIGWLVQEDSARDTNAFWRSRPITPGCLITAKLALIGGAVALSIALIHFAGGGLTSKPYPRCKTPPGPARPSITSSSRGSSAKASPRPPRPSGHGGCVG